MNPYLVLPLTACMTSAMLGAGILARGVHHRANRLGAVLLFGAAWWSFCEVLWNTASDPEIALWLVRASALGWVAIGPIALQLFLELTADDGHPLRRVFPWLYAVPVAFGALALATPWIHEGVVPTSWGWGYVFGPLYIVFYAFTVACIGRALALGFRNLREVATAGERSQARTLTVGIAIPLIVASLTDGLLPWLGWQPPRLGTASLTMLGASLAWSAHRHGYSLLVPGDFASEILGTLREGVALLRLDGRIRSTNGGLARLIDLDERLLVNHDVRTWLRGIRLDLDPDEETSEQEGTLLPTDGPPIPIAASTALLRDKQRQPIGLVLVVRDLREVASLRSRLVTSGRLAAVGQLAAGIAHEINNPIAYVRANLGSLRGVLDDLEKASAEHRTDTGVGALLRESRELIDESLEGVERVTAIVRDVKSFSHAGGGPREPVELPPLLDAVLRVAAPQLRYGGRVERRFADDLPPVLGDAQQLKQVFLNLVINASQAVRGDQAIRIHAHACAPDRVAVVVEDEGCGIPPEVIGSIFDPFFTTKRVGDGTGLGLAIAYQIVRHHGGDLSVESELGRGTRFRVELPTAIGAA